MIGGWRAKKKTRLHDRVHLLVHPEEDVFVEPRRDGREPVSDVVAVEDVLRVYSVPDQLGVVGQPQKRFLT